MDLRWDRCYFKEPIVGDDGYYEKKRDGKEAHKDGRGNIDLLQSDVSAPGHTRSACLIGIFASLLFTFFLTTVVIQLLVVQDPKILTPQEQALVNQLFDAQRYDINKPMLNKRCNQHMQNNSSLRRLDGFSELESTPHAHNDGSGCALREGPTDERRHAGPGQAEQQQMKGSGRHRSCRAEQRVFYPGMP
jgi:hypothetical protein